MNFLFETIIENDNLVVTGLCFLKFGKIKYNLGRKIEEEG